MNLKFNVKNKSVASFLSDKLLGYIPNERNGIHGREEDTAYNLLQDVMFFKKDCGIEIGEEVKIELFDRGLNSHKKLINTYIYISEYYDDVSIKMVLSEFSVSAEEGIINH